MKVLLLSDIHGNFDALEAVFAKVDRKDFREVWFLGDLGGYGPETNRCFERLMAEKVLMIPGNHDAYYAGHMGRDFFSTEALQALIISGQNITESYRKMMKSLPEISFRKGCTLVHGSLTNPLMDYILHPDEGWENFRLLRKNKILLFGHTHQQGCYLEEENGEMDWLTPVPGQMVSFSNNRILINPGSVGQPRDGDPRAAWALLDLRKKEVVFHRTDYDIPSYQKKMKRMGASDFLINRVEKGI